jgi:hypothetical protein
MPVYAGHRDGGSHAVLLSFYKYGVDDYWRQPNAPSMCLRLGVLLCLGRVDEHRAIATLLIRSSGMYDCEWETTKIHNRTWHMF